MPAIIETWDATLPPDSENPTLGANRIRELKRAIAERAINGGESYPTGAVASSGRFKCGVQGVTGVVDLVYEADDDVAVSVHDDTAATKANTVLLGTGRGGARDYTLEVENVNSARHDVSEFATLSGIVAKTFANSPYNVGTESIIIFNCAGGASFVDLPSAAAAAGRLLFIKSFNTTTHSLTVRATAGQNIRHGAGLASQLILPASGQGVVLIAGSAVHWEVLANS